MPTVTSLPSTGSYGKLVGVEWSGVEWSGLIICSYLEHLYVSSTVLQSHAYTRLLCQYFDQSTSRLLHVKVTEGDRR